MATMVYHQPPAVVRRWGNSAIRALLLLAATVAVAANPSAAPRPPARPNIIIILADDLSYRDLSCFGQTNFSTPNIDRLAAQGRIFANAYAGGPWCAPSRTSLLTGRSTAHLAPLARDARGRVTKYNPTVAEMLQSAGYATCALGKWHMAETEDTWSFAKTWAEQKAAGNPLELPWHRGFEVCRIGYRAGGNPYYPHQIECSDTEEISLPQNANVDSDWLYHYIRGGPAAAAAIFDAQGRFVDKTGKDSSQLCYAEDFYRAAALAFMQTNRARPFFLYYASPLMHGPLGVKELGEFKDKPAPWTYPHKLWAAMARELDRSVGLLTGEVERLGLATNTIILFASDNGYAEWGYFGRAEWTDDPVFHNKGPWNRGKFVTANGGVMIPFIAWGPGRVPPHSTTSRAINFYDFMATAGELAATLPPGPTEGVSYVPLLEGRDQDQPLRTAMAWSSSSCYLSMTDDFDPAATPAETPAKISTKKPVKYQPDAVLLDERWYVLGIRKAPAPAPLTLRVFDITADPGCHVDLSAARPDLGTRAAAEFKKLDAKAPDQS